MEDKEKIAAFLREYRELCERHGLMVGGNWDPDGLFVDEIRGCFYSGTTVSMGTTVLDRQIEDLERQAELKDESHA